MKKILLVFYVFISLNVFSQLQVKEGSFKREVNAVMDDKYDHYDDNEEPMALIKISTVNINEYERKRLAFKGNRMTQIVKKYLNGQVWLYISHVADYIEISHPDYSLITFDLPETLCGFCVYEMTLENVIYQNRNDILNINYLLISSDQKNAEIFIDDEYVGEGEVSRSFVIGTTHNWRIQSKFYHTESGSVTITSGDAVVVEKTMRPAYGYIKVDSKPEKDAIVYINGDRVGKTPYTSDKLESGNYKVKVVKEMYKPVEQTFSVTDGNTTNAVLNMEANFVNVTINADPQSDIYLDNEYKGKGSWSGRLLKGDHYAEARKMSHETSGKFFNLVPGNDVTITLDEPQPISGHLDINSSPMRADIYIDGKHYGQTPKIIRALSIGEHELKLTKPGFAELKKTITVQNGEILTVNENLQHEEEMSVSDEQPANVIDVVNVEEDDVAINQTVSDISNEVKEESNEKEDAPIISIVQEESVDSVELFTLKNQTFTVNGVSFTMIAVDGKTFQMGATPEQKLNAESDEMPVHSVTLSYYYIGETEVTQELWYAVMGENHSNFKGDKKPVEQISWNDCWKFIKNLNKLTGKEFRLPTEAEWEYAARGGNMTNGYRYSGGDNLENIAWYHDNSASQTHDVKTKDANELGIYDMSGNVWEWCADRYGKYESVSQTNPTGPSSGSYRILRGGSCFNMEWSCRVSERNYNSPGNKGNLLGLRLCLSE